MSKEVSIGSENDALIASVSSGSYAHQRWMGIRPGVTKLVPAESPIEHVVPAMGTLEMGTGYFAGDALS